MADNILYGTEPDNDGKDRVFITYSSLPAASTFGVGTAQVVDTGEVYKSNGLVWTPITKNSNALFTGVVISDPSGRAISEYQVVGAGSTISMTSTLFGATDISNTVRCNINRGSATATDVNILHAISPVLEKTGRAGVWVYVEDYTKLASIVLKISLGGTAYANGNFQTYNFADLDKQFIGWHFIAYDLAEYGGVYGTPDWTTQTLQNIKITANQNSADATTIYIGKWVCGWRRKGRIMITADDGYASWFNYGIPVLDTMGLKSVSAIIAAQIGANTTWATINQLKAAANNGHEMVAHGAASLATLISDSAIRADLRFNRAFLVNNGLTKGIEFYVYPNGVYQISAGDQTIINALKSEGFKCGRGTVSPRSLKPTARMSDAKWNIPTIGVSGATATSAIKTQIDNVITYGSFSTLMYHDIVLSGGSTAVTRNLTDFVDEMSYLSQKVDAGLVEIVVASEFMAQEGL